MYSNSFLLTSRISTAASVWARNSCFDVGLRILHQSHCQCEAGRGRHDYLIVLFSKAKWKRAKFFGNELLDLTGTAISSFGILQNSAPTHKHSWQMHSKVNSYPSLFRNISLFPACSLHFCCKQASKIINGRKTHSMYVSWQVTLTLNSFQDACAQLAPSRQIPPPARCRWSKWVKVRRSHNLRQTPNHTHNRNSSSIIYINIATTDSWHKHSYVKPRTPNHIKPPFFEGLIVRLQSQLQFPHVPTDFGFHWIRSLHLTLRPFATYCTASASPAAIIPELLRYQFVFPKLHS